MKLVKKFGDQDFTVTLSETNGNYESLKIEDYVFVLHQITAAVFR